MLFLYISSDCWRSWCGKAFQTTKTKKQHGSQRLARFVVEYRTQPRPMIDLLPNKEGDLMMLPSDMALLNDNEFRKYVEMYSKDEDLFFKDFAAAFAKLLELGVVYPYQPIVE